MSDRRRGSAAVLPVLALGLLAGCAGADETGSAPAPADTDTDTATSTSAPEPTSSPTPEPEETGEPRPTLEDLTLTPSGIGPLTVGEPPEDNRGAEMITWDADRCAQVVADDQEAGRWVADGYEDDTDPRGEPVRPFHVGVDEDSVFRIDVLGTTPTTEEGAGIGTPLTELQEIYPDLQGPYDGVLSRAWWLEGDGGTLVFETQSEDMGPGGPYEEETVVLIRILEPGVDPAFTTMATDDIAGGCL